MSTHSSLSGHVCIITGGADGLGLALAKFLSEAGATLCLLDRNEEKLQIARAQFGENCRAYPVDITDENAVQATIEEVMKAYQRIDALVNCAGITGCTGIRTHEISTEDFARVFSVNVLGTLHTCKHALPHMLARGYGRILNVASIAGKEGNAGMVSYSAAKAAVIGMTKSMGKEYAGTGITINALAPAVIRTALVEAMPEEQVTYMTDKIPMKRCGTLEEFAEMAAFIISPQTSFTTAFTFDLSGGRAVY